MIRSNPKQKDKLLKQLERERENLAKIQNDYERKNRAQYE